MFANLRRYATFVADVLRDNDKAEKYYEMAVKADPSHAINLGRYAFFLQTVRGDNGKAEGLYQRAVDADSDNADILGNYANFLETVRNNTEYAMHVDVVDGRVFSVVLICFVRCRVSVVSAAVVAMFCSDDSVVAHWTHCKLTQPRRPFVIL